MTETTQQTHALTDVQWQRFLRGPDSQLLEGLYIPALSRAVRYDRCCAYFSSHVLAVAARGFGGFIENILARQDTLPKPAARLLVNEELDADDLDALLTADDQAPLIDMLLKQFKTPRRALEKNRLAMLAWLVAHDWLEVRVGLMRRTQGINHAKYGIITDAHGNHLAFMGSDNETGHALVENYEEVTTGTSWDDADFVENYQARFDALWEDRDEFVKTVPLPEAVRLKLITFAPEQPPPEPPIDTEEAAATMMWHFIAAAPFLPNGEFASDATAMVDLWPHQKRVVDEAANAFPAGRLLCDAVGMGKTIEAILILRRLLNGRGVKRALILVPAGLLQQWQDEFREKGGLLVPYWDRNTLFQPNGVKESMEASEALRKHDVILISREWARRDNNREVVLSASRWDLVLLDEAHAARRKASVEGEFNVGNLLLQLLRELQLRNLTRGILLLSATPMQTQPWEPWDLLTVLGVGGPWMVEFRDIRTYYDGIAGLRSTGVDIPTATAMGQLIAHDDGFPSPPLPIQTTTPQGIGQGLAFCPLGEQRETCANWLRRGAPLGRYMHRNTRNTLKAYHKLGLLDSPPPTRQLKDVVFDYQSQAERDCYEAITRYIDRRYDELESERGGKGFVMTVYRRRAVSSPRALRRSLGRRIELLDRVIRKQWLEDAHFSQEEEIDPRDLSDADMDDTVNPALPTDPEVAAAEKKEIESLLQQLDDLGHTDSKLRKFWTELKAVTADGRSVLVFSEYFDTLVYLRDRLRPSYGKTLGCFSGGGGQIWNGEKWQSVSKAEVTSRLQDGQLNVLICTDAASEGLNLQAASAVINYDLPWNPSKVEQRIGRIDRIGQQQKELLIRNLFIKDSVDMLVYGALQDRCDLFTHFVGYMQPVLAKARIALKSNLKGSQVESFLSDLGNEANAVQLDVTVTNAFVESEAQSPGAKILPPVTRQDIDIALESLSELNSLVKATYEKKLNAWRLSGLRRRAVKVTTDRDTLERNPEVLPMTLGTELLEQLAAKLPRSSCMPLLVAEHTAGPFRCAEARWVHPDGIVVVESAGQLRDLIDAWDGTSPPPALVTRADTEAAGAAKKRVLDMQERARERQEAGLERQLEAARRRLMRELGRTLRCIGSGDLTVMFPNAVRREAQLDGRYHKALQVLGGYPQWSPDEVAAINKFVKNLKPKQIKARIAGSEIDAALHDPRWMARESLDQLHCGVSGTKSRLTVEMG